MCVWNRLETEHDECAARDIRSRRAVARWGGGARARGTPGGRGAAAGVGGPLLAIEKLRREARPCYFSLTP